MQLALENSARVTQAFAGSTPLDPSASLDVLGPVVHSKQYRITEQIGEGGMGWVYRAYDPMLERWVGLKVLKPGLPEGARKRFRAEARFGAKLCHPNVVRVFDLGVLVGPGLEWFAMEYLPGRDLETLLERAVDRSKRLPPRVVHIVFDRVLDALQHAHDRGIVHRDVKPSNIFVTRLPGSDRIGVKLIDFGVAIELHTNPRDNEVCGDPRFVAPEQALGDPDLDHRADIYSAGMTLFQALTGRHPFEGELHNTASLIGAQCSRAVPPVSQFLPKSWPQRVLRNLDELVGCACEKDPALRFSSAAHMRAAIRDSLAQLA